MGFANQPLGADSVSKSTDFDTSVSLMTACLDVAPKAQHPSRQGFLRCSAGIM